MKKQTEPCVLNCGRRIVHTGRRKRGRSVRWQGGTKNPVFIIVVGFREKETARNVFFSRCFFATFTLLNCQTPTDWPAQGISDEKDSLLCFPLFNELRQKAVSSLRPWKEQYCTYPYYFYGYTSFLMERTLFRNGSHPCIKTNR